MRIGGPFVPDNREPVGAVEGVGKWPLWKPALINGEWWVRGQSEPVGRKMTGFEMALWLRVEALEDLERSLSSLLQEARDTLVDVTYIIQGFGEPKYAGAVRLYTPQIALSTVERWKGVISKLSGALPASTRQEKP